MIGDAAPISHHLLSERLPFIPAYVDPCKYSTPPTLLGGLMAVPAKIRLNPLENQVTTVLAWLLARSDDFARSFCRLFMDGPATGALDESHKVGTRTWITLPSLPGTGRLYPDLSIEGCNRLFQLLAEVKVDAGLHDFPALGGGDRSEGRVKRGARRKDDAGPSMEHSSAIG